MGQQRGNSAASAGRSPRADAFSAAILILFGWAAPVNTIARTSTSRLVDLDATLAPNGTVVFVNSVRDLFTLDKTSALLTDATTVVDAIGGGQWIRTINTNEFWARQSEWFIDPAVATDDEGSGLAGDPLGTHAELERRFVDHGLAIGQSTTVTFNSQPAVDDRTINMNVKATTKTNVLLYTAVVSVARSGTLTAGTAALVSGTSLPVVEDTVGGSWAAQINKRISVSTAGTFKGLGFLMRDDGASQASTMQLGSYQVAAQPLGPLLPVQPAAGDTYEVHDLISVRLGRIEVTGPYGVARLGAFTDLQIGDTDDDSPKICTNLEMFTFFGCDIRNHGFLSANVGFNACQFATNSLFVNCTVGLTACGLGSSGVQFSACTVSMLTETTAVGTPLVQDSSGNSVTLGKVSGHDSPSSGVFVGLNTEIAVTGLLWGTGNTNYGINAQKGRLFYAPGTQPTIVGAIGNTRVGGTDRTYATIPFFNIVNGAGIVEAAT